MLDADFVFQAHVDLGGQTWNNGGIARQVSFSYSSCYPPPCDDETTIQTRVFETKWPMIQFICQSTDASLLWTLYHRTDFLSSGIRLFRFSRRVEFLYEGVCSFRLVEIVMMSQRNYRLTIVKLTMGL